MSTHTTPATPARTIVIGFLWLAVATAASAAPVELTPDATALVKAMEGHRVILLGEVHDNAAQHALHLEAVRRLVANGARPAIAFEQFDQERQPDIERARRERPKDAAYLVAQAKGDPAWNWEYYRPFVALALEYDLPIVAANLSRGKAMQVATDGWPALFDARTRTELHLDDLPADLRRKHEKAIATGHCNLLPASALPARARAQMARDIVMAQTIRPYADRGVILLAGDGHVRRDIGVVYWLPQEVARNAVTIGALERDEDSSAPESATDFDAYVVTASADRVDPCKGLAKSGVTK